MGLKAGIVGLPNVGKSTLFSGLTKMKAESANYPFTTLDPNISIVELNDERLDILSNMVKTQKVHLVDNLEFLYTYKYHY